MKCTLCSPCSFRDSRHQYGGISSYKKIENYVVTTKLIGIFLDTSLAGHQELTYSIPMVHFSRPCLVETFRSCIHGVYKLRAKHAAKKENISTKSVHNKGKYKLLIQFPRTSGGKADFSPRQPHHPRVQIETLTQKTHSTTMGRGPQSWASRRTGPRKITGTSVHTKKKKKKKEREGDSSRNQFLPTKHRFS